MATIPRYVPQVPLPAATYIPGRPAPDSHAEWHSLGATLESAAPLGPAQWQVCVPYLYGIDLFNHGFYWEAHEAWELLWHRAGRRGQTARFLQGLIKLAAAGVKVLEQRPAGVIRHAHRAAEIFRSIAVELGHPDVTLLGLQPSELARQAAVVAAAPPVRPRAPLEAVAPVFTLQLVPAQPMLPN